MLALAGGATALATGLGAIPVSHLGRRAEEIRPVLWGLTVGLMSVAAVLGLLLPAFDGESNGPALAGLAVGIAFLLVSRHALEGRDVHVGALSGAGVRRSVLVFAVLLVHSLPEGFAIGTAYASETEGLGLFVILAIALQNIPEGTSVAIPMEAAGFSARQQFWAAVLSSAPQPIGAMIAYALVNQIESLLPFSLPRRRSDAGARRGRARTGGLPPRDLAPRGRRNRRGRRVDVRLGAHPRGLTPCT